MSQEVENHRVRPFVHCASKVREANDRNQIWTDYTELKEALYMRSDARITYNREGVFEAEVEKEGMRYLLSKDGKSLGLFVYSEENDFDVSYEAMEKFYTVAGRPDEL